MSENILTSVRYEIKINPFRNESVIMSIETAKAKYKIRDQVVIQINKENLLGEIVNIKDNVQILPDYKNHIVRLASESDLSHKKSLGARIDETKQFFEQLLKKFKLSAKVVFIDWDLNQHKVYCYLTSDKKINYLLLHETAVDTLKTRVSIKQVGVRDFAKCIGGLGSCGRELCCQKFLQSLQSVTLTMARQQNLYIEPEKISGVCGKLRCCIAFECYSCETRSNNGKN
jgi:cell fate regulator YaaT (PSP1 superfamily)